MSAVPRISALLVGLLACLTLAACGASKGNTTEDKNTYVKQVNAAVNKFATTVTAVSKSITPDSSTGQDRRTIRRFEAAIKDVIGTLETIKVPTDVGKEHRLLVAAMTGFGKEIAAAGRAMRTQTISAIAEGQRKLGAATITVNAKIRTATDAINTRLKAK
jgi:predicted small secreted protein